MSPSAESTEAQLVSRAAKGDERAFGQLYESYLSPIYRYFYYRTGDRQEAEDFSEQTFLKAWEHIAGKKNRPIRNFRSWLFSIAHNVLVDQRRKAKPLSSLEEVTDATSEQIAPEAHMSQQEEEQQLLAVLDKLDEKQKQVIIYRFVSGLSHNETADLMNLKEGNVRVLQHRALVALRSLLQKEGLS